VALLLLVAAELVARFGLGLGDPPVYVRDPDIEYLYAPSQRVRYLGHEVAINSHSMRAAEFAAQKSDPREYRVMVIGDSIVAGGGRVDQANLATERLSEALRHTLRRPVVVGAIAAGSWGPPNQLAFARKFGLFDADAVIFVLNSGDVDDVPGLEAVGAAWPMRKPMLALQEPLQRGIERLAPSLADMVGWRQPARVIGYDQRVEQSRAALGQLAAQARAAGARVGAVVYLTRPELRSTTPTERVATLQRWLDELDVPHMSTRDEPALFTDDAALFLPGDDVHPSDVGHQRLALALQAMCDRLLTFQPGSRPRTPQSDTPMPALPPAR
jgi:hypothetical protein